MTHLYVNVRLHGDTVDDRLVRIFNEVRIGESDGSAVSFPGADIVVRRVGRRLLIRGRWLDVGESWNWSFGAIEVTLEAVKPQPMARSWSWAPDVRLVVGSAAVALLGAFVDTMEAYVRQNADEFAFLFSADSTAETNSRSAQMHVLDQEDVEPLIIEVPITSIDARLPEDGYPTAVFRVLEPTLVIGHVQEPDLSAEPSE